MKKIKYYLLSIFLFYILLTVMLLIASAIFAYTNVKDNYIEPVIYFSIAISSFISSFVLCRNIRKNGIANGIITNVISLFILFIISSICNNNLVISNTFGIYILVVCTTGALGGILGVNV